MHGVFILEDYFRVDITSELIESFYNIVCERISDIELILKKLNLDVPNQIVHDDFKEVLQLLQIAY